MLHCDFGESTYRKKRAAFDKMLQAHQKTITNSQEQLKELDDKIQELRKERQKLQTINIERNRIDRSQARQELYYEYVGSMINTLPLPDFLPLLGCSEPRQMEYLCCISDLHYGAKFVSDANEYSPQICRERLGYLVGQLYDFISYHSVNEISIASLGDTLQGCLRLSDLKINDSSVVKASVEVSRLISQFLNSVSKFVKVKYYHVPAANHTQLRFLGSKANEIADEDLEYLIGNYIKDLCADNKRICVNLADEGEQYIDIPIYGYDIGAMHGHQVKNPETLLKDFNAKRDLLYDYLVIGHYHNGRELSGSERSMNDSEVLVCPSFMGSDPYADRLMRGSKAAVKIFGFDELYGHTETYKIILN